MVTMAAGVLVMLGAGAFATGHDADRSVHVNYSVSEDGANGVSDQASALLLDQDHSWT
ncbi:hypothetical protein RMN57_19620 [Kitasatospora sp. CM 4170]|uniref:Uncharacterized protein n=1 Tax=Kitasatospora aburaviensis TaxID=67265 RepID=A0ABW1EW52_9ACTN|nr:hypothetical protein [Kitasatospora sp. CM 4170]WNM46752.1 hypothetical protein RMN57_19620 [Kitasatospora sp. CM 4170]